ncbi:MAG: hypothetical protein F4X55_07890 [Candidatus Dadabacteria bacterium]|nr:hypothetical protein [Candidatus Dadabacteria bacterium]
MKNIKEIKITETKPTISLDEEKPITAFEGNEFWDSELTSQAEQPDDLVFEFSNQELAKK